MTSKVFNQKTSYFSSSQEIPIDDILVEKGVQSDVELDNINSRMMASGVFDITLGDIRFSKYYEQKKLLPKKKSWWQKCYQRCFQKQKTQNRVFKQMRDIENNQSNLLKDYVVFERENEQSAIQRFFGRTIQGLKVIEPDSYLYITWEILNSILVWYFFFEIPFMTFFEYDMSESEIAVSYIKWMLLVGILIFTLDIFVTLNTAIYIQGKLELNRSKIAKSYLKTYFICDIIPVLCLVSQLVYQDTIFFYVGVLYFLKIYQLFQVQEKFQHIFRLKRRSSAAYSLIQLMIWMIFICHIFACFFYGIAQLVMRINPGADTWLTASSLRQNIYLLPIPDQYSYSFYWSVTTMISVGYGDITPKNTPEVLITVFTMFVSCIVFAYSINTIWEVIREVNESKHSYYKKVTAINRFMHDNKVNNKLQHKIEAYLAHMWEADRNRDIEAEQLMIKKLAPALREELIFDTFGLFLQRTPLFIQNFTLDFLRELSQDIEEMRFSEMESIFSASDPEWDDLSIYYIVSGQVEIYISQGQVIHSLCILQDQQSFGQVGFIGGIRRTSSARCKEYSKVYKLSRQKFIARLESFQKDKEIFHQMRDKLLFQGKFKKLSIKCLICDSELHLAENCDKTHYVVQQHKLILEQNKQVNKRYHLFERRKRQAFQTLKSNRDIVQEASTYTYQQLLKSLEVMTKFYHDITFSENCSEEEFHSEFQEEMQQFSMKSEKAQCDGNEAEIEYFEEEQIQQQERESQQREQNDQLLTKSMILNQLSVNQQPEDEGMSLQSEGMFVYIDDRKVKVEETPRQKGKSIQCILQKGSNKEKNWLKNNKIIQINTPDKQAQEAQIKDDRLRQMRIKSRSIQPNKLRKMTMLSDQAEIPPDQKPGTLQKNLNILSYQLSGENLGLLQEIRDAVDNRNETPDNEQYGKKTKDTMCKDEFSVDLMHNYTNYFPEDNPKCILLRLKRHQKRSRKTFRAL